MAMSSTTLTYDPHQETWWSTDGGWHELPNWPEEEPTLELANGEKFEVWDDVRYWRPQLVVKKEPPAVRRDDMAHMTYNQGSITWTTNDTVQPGEMIMMSGNSSAVLKFEPD